VAKSQCLRKWSSKGCELIADTVVAAVESAKASDAWTKDKGAFIPAPLVWLNQDRWEAPTEAQAAAEVPENAWHETRKGIVAKGIELGVGEWTEEAWIVGADRNLTHL
jgi:hypothetical protein